MKLQPIKPSFAEKPRIIYLFYDGIGFGTKNEDTNPFSRYSVSYLSALGGKTSSQELPEGWEIIITDSHLGVDGLPQSATGQTALWTGINGSRLMGRHMTGFPGPTLIDVIKEYSIIKQFCQNNYTASLLNAYSQMYIERMEKKPRLRSVSSHIQLASGQAYKTLGDLEQGSALYMDYTHEVMHEIYPELRDRFPVQKAYDRGCDFAEMARFDLNIHEFFLTDRVGHDQSWEKAKWCIHTIESFLDGLVKNLDPKRDLLLITSDHGNMEDLTTKMHTSNAVPTFVYGKYAKEAVQKIQKLTDIPRFIYDVMKINVAFPPDL